MMGMRLFLRQQRPYLYLQRAAISDLHPKVGETDNGSYFVVWHPEKKIPYEYTRPLPTSEKVESNAGSPLKLDSEEAYSVFKQKTPEVIREELMEITSTTKHRWFPRARDKRAKKTPPDRPYL
ncbi:39S ribosomal protein L42, mitochondrial [Ischnura elegans]|uniref:39S ribosomal protein L42, mitochondrial n=1 Tax=Ischnura elegans TaxID=197161 RepID=UPI001ED88613|nr:39S ribosomal protein L42, mitochondrial [Ischnura elegans]XP_046384635.1 39S ribosomal protein L42, mitochondrial [Ischnura elegans]